MKARAQCGTGRTVDGDAEPIPQLLQALSVRRHLGGWLILAFRTSSRLFGALPCLLFACAAPSIALLATAQTSADGPRILPHVTIAGLDVGGLTASEAVEVLSTQVADELSREITLRAPDHEFAITLRDLGGRADLEDAVARALDVGRGQTVPTALREAVDSILGSFEVDLPIVLEPARARTITEGLLSDVRREPRDARATVANGELVIEPHIVGVEPDVQATTEALIEAAHRGDPADRVTALALGAALRERELWSEAAQVYRTLAMHHEGDPSAARFLERYEAWGHMRPTMDGAEAP